MEFQILKKDLKKKKKSKNKDDDTNMELMNEGKTNTLFCFFIFFIRTNILDEVFRDKDWKF